MRRVVWCLPAMAFFGQLAAETLECELMVGGFVGDCDVVHIVGMYDPPTYEHTLRCTSRAKKRVIHWCGTDVLLCRPESLPEAVHIADSEQLSEELRAYGIEATPIMWPTRHHFPVTPLGEKVAVYLGTSPEKYGHSVIQAVADALPEVQFIGYMHGTYDAEHMADVVSQCRAMLRVTEHDGSAASPREFMEAGRRAIVTHSLKHATRVSRSDPAGIIAAVRRVVKETEPDLEAAEYWAKQNSPERFKEELCRIT